MEVTCSKGIVLKSFVKSLTLVSHLCLWFCLRVCAWMRACVRACWCWPETRGIIVKMINCRPATKTDEVYMKYRRK